jgi:DNA-binding NarL/FixJ family response regulator
LINPQVEKRAYEACIPHHDLRYAAQVRSGATGGTTAVSEELDGVTAVVVDELALARAGIIAVLRAQGIEIVAETHAAKEAARLVAMDGCDLVVLGTAVDLPVGDAARRLVAGRPRPAVVAMVSPAATGDVAYLVALGIEGVVLRSGSTEELADAVAAATKGVQHVAPALHGALTGALRPRPVDDGPLSSREREVLAYLADGLTNRQIATAMVVSLATVKTHLVHVYAKLGASNRNEALGRALSLGLLG